MNVCKGHFLILFLFQGQNRKHLEINARSSSNTNDHHLCFFAVRGGPDKCPYQEGCKHSHDLVGYLARRPVDLHPRCYMFDTYGRCFYGLLCRFGQSHVDPVTGQNLIDSANQRPYLEPLNKYPPMLKHLLRRKKYDYTLSDQLVRTANKEITKAIVIKRNNPVTTEEEKPNGEKHHDNQDVGEKDDRSLVNIYYSALTVEPPPKDLTNQETVRTTFLLETRHRFDKFEKLMRRQFLFGKLLFESRFDSIEFRRPRISPYRCAK